MQFWSQLFQTSSAIESLAPLITALYMFIYILILPTSFCLIRDVLNTYVIHMPLPSASGKLHIHHHMSAFAPKNLCCFPYVYHGEYIFLLSLYFVLAPYIEKKFNQEEKWGND